MSAGNVVTSECLQKGSDWISPSVHGTIQSTSISFYILCRIVQSQVSGKNRKYSLDFNKFTNFA